MDETITQLKRRANQLKDGSTVTNEQINELVNVSWLLLYNQPYNAKLTEQALQKAKSNQYWLGYAYALRNIAWQKFSEGKFQDVTRISQKYKEIAVDLNDDNLLGNFHHTLSCLNLKTTDLNAAKANAFKALELFKVAGVKKSLSQPLNVLGGISFRQGDYPATLDYYYQALSASDEHERPSQKARIYNNIGFALLTIDETEEALEYIHQAERIWSDFEDEINKGSALENLGTAYRKLKQYKKAFDYYSQSLDITLKQNQFETAADAQVNLGRLYLETNDIQSAFLHFNNSLQLSHQINSRFYQSKALLYLGLAYEQQGEAKRSLENLYEALKLCEENGLDEIGSRTHQALSKIYEKDNNVEKAFAHYKAYHEYWNRVHGAEMVRKSQQIRFQYKLAQAQLQNGFAKKAAIIENDSRAAGDGSSKLSPSKLRQAINYIEQHLEQNVSVEQVADAVNLNQHYFLRSFKQSTGKTPHQFLLEQRVKRAQQLLTTTEATLAEIAYSCGFSSQSHLTTQFKLATGCTPSKYRQAD